MINNIIDCMVKHRSIRAYTDEAVSKEELDVIVKAVQAAPQLGESTTCFHSDNQGCGAEKTVQQAVWQPAAYCQSSRISDFLC